jgi:hypothetical protein
VYISYPYIHAIHIYILEYIHICTCRFTDGTDLYRYVPSSTYYGSRFQMISSLFYLPD